VTTSAENAGEKLPESAEKSSLDHITIISLSMHIIIHNVFLKRDPK